MISSKEMEYFKKPNSSEWYSEMLNRFGNLSLGGGERTISSEIESTLSTVLRSVPRVIYERNRPQRIDAKNNLISSRSFSKDKFYREYFKVYRQIRADSFGNTIDKKIIHYLPRTGRTKYRQTNLHAAVMEENLEKTYCLIEFHQKYHGCVTFDINLRDSRGKTVLDYAKEKESSFSRDLLIAYLKENNAKQSINTMLNRLN